MKRQILGILVISLMVIAVCKNNNGYPNIIGNYEGKIDGDEVNLSIYLDSPYVQTVQNKTLGEMQFNGKFKWLHDPLYLIDEYRIFNGRTTSTKEVDQDLSEEGKHRILKLIHIDKKTLILRDLRTQRIWEYLRKGI